MVAIDKAYFTLEEIEERWGVPRRDIAYLAENGMLKVSVRVFGVRIEVGSYEEDSEGRWFNIPEEQKSFHGLLGLLARDAHQLFHIGTATVQHFEASDWDYCSVLWPEEGVPVKIEELVISRDERDRIEKQHGLLKAASEAQQRLIPKNDFEEITLGARTYNFGPIQAKVVRILYEAANTESPWRHGKQVLAEAGSSCTRLADLFKTQPDWRELIQSDRRGKYRLNLPSV